jgi:hypothetical protein
MNLNRSKFETVLPVFCDILLYAKLLIWKKLTATSYREIYGTLRWQKFAKSVWNSSPFLVFITGLPKMLWTIFQSSWEFTVYNYGGQLAPPYDSQRQVSLWVIILGCGFVLQLQQRHWPDEVRTRIATLYGTLLWLMNTKEEYKSTVFSSFFSYAGCRNLIELGSAV